MTVLKDASKARLYISDAGGDLRDVSPYLVSISGLPGQRTLLPATTVEDTGRKSHPGIQQADVRGEFLWSDDSEVGSHTVFEALFEDTTPRAFRYGPEGDTEGDEMISGTWLMRLLDEPTRVNTMQSCLVEFEVQGAVTLSAFPA